MPHLVEVQNKYRKKGLRVVGVTDVNRDEAQAYAKELGVNYTLLASAEADREAYGIDMIWGSEIYLINPEGRLVADGIEDVDKRLAKEFP